MVVKFKPFCTCPPVSLWVESQRVLSIRSDRSQMFLYQAHLLVFATAVLQILFTDVDGSGEVYFVGMLNEKIMDIIEFFDAVRKCSV